MTAKLRHVDLFSGIGGFALGLRRTGGFETVQFVEIDPYCRRVLAKHWPDVPCHDDVRTFDATGLGTVDIITGGFPCQPFSLAGARRGTEDDRYLWPQTRALIEACRPAWCILENVAGLSSMVFEFGKPAVESRTGGRNENGVDYISVFLRENRMLLGVICDAFGEIGYAVQPLVIPACAVDAPHRRDRVWIVARNADSEDGRTKRGIRSGSDTITSGSGSPMAHASRLQPGRQEQRPERQRAGAAGQPVHHGHANGQGEPAMADADGSRHGRTEKPGLHRSAQGERQADHTGDGSCRPGITGEPAMADADGVRCCEGNDERSGGEPGRSVETGRGEQSGGTCSSERRTGAIWQPEPDVGRVASRLSFGLDDCRGRLDEYATDLARAKGVAAFDAQAIGLRALRQYGEIAEASSQLRGCSGDRNSLQDVSRRVARRYAAGEAYEGMCDLWDAVSAQPLEETQDVFKGVLVRNWKTQCDEALGQRVNRLRALGNAVVPAVVTELGHAILQAEAPAR